MQNWRVLGKQVTGLCGVYRLYLELDRLRHGSEVDGKVGGIGNQGAVWTKHRAGEVQAFLDVDRYAGPLQDLAHLLGNPHEPECNPAIRRIEDLP